MKDLYRKAGCRLMGGPGGIKCPCCDNGYSKKRKSKARKSLYSKNRRTLLKRETEKEIVNEIEDNRT